MAQSEVAKPSADQPPDVPQTDDDRDQWKAFFAADVRALAQEIFVHICGDSCHKYSGKKKEKICRHGFYYIVNLSDWESRHDGVSFRRQGKALRNAMFVVKQTKHGMQGRHPHPTWLKHWVPDWPEPVWLKHRVPGPRCQGAVSAQHLRTPPMGRRPRAAPWSTVSG